MFRTKDTNGNLKKIGETVSDLNTALTSASGTNVNDLWFEYLREQGHTTGSLDDRMFAWLVNTKGVGVTTDLPAALDSWDGNLI